MADPLKGQTSDKSASLYFAVTIGSGSFLLGIFKDFGPNEWRKLRCGQHALDDRCRQTGGFVVGFYDGPGGASSEPKRLGLLIECEESRSDKSVPEFPDFGRLLLSHVCTPSEWISARLSRSERLRNIFK